MRKSLWKNSIWVVCFVMMMFLVPGTISLPAQTELRSIIVAVGIDKPSENEYEVSTEIVVPQYSTSYNQNAQVISAIGENAIDALGKISIQLGKVVGLSHCSAIVIGESLKNDNIVDVLDQFLRGKRVNYNSLLTVSNNSAKEVLKKAVEIEKEYGQNINNILQYNNEFINAQTILLSDFYKTYYDGYGASFVPIVDLSENDYEGLSGGSSGQSQSEEGGEGSSQGSGNQGSSGEEKQQYLSNIGDTAILKNGKLVKIMTSDEMRGFSLMKPGANRGIVNIYDVNDETLTNATLSMSLRHRTINRWIEFSEQGIPRIYFRIDTTVRLEQIINDERNIKLANDSHDFFTKEVSSKFCDKIKEYCADAVNISKELNVDVLNIYKTFDKFAHNKWQKYIKSLANKDDYIQKVEFFMEVNVKNVD